MGCEVGTKNIKYIISLFLFAFIFLIFNIPQSLALTEEQCMAGGGVWTEKIGCDPKEGEICPQYYCKCSQGYVLEEEGCMKISDDTLCINSDGEWMNNKCVCPENSIGWTKGVGCDYELTTENIENPNLINSTESSSNLLILVFIVITILVSGLIIIKYKWVVKK